MKNHSDTTLLKMRQASQSMRTKKTIFATIFTLLLMLFSAVDMGHLETTFIEQSAHASFSKQDHQDTLNGTVHTPEETAQGGKSIRLFYDHTFPTFDWEKNLQGPLRCTFFDILEDVLRECGNLKIVRSPEEANLIVVLPFFKNGTLYHGEHQNKAVIGLSAEAYTFDPDQVTLSLGFPHLVHERYLRLPYYVFRFKDEISIKASRSQDFMRKHTDFCGFLVSNGSTKNMYDRTLDGVIARDGIFKKLSQYKPVKSGGKHLNNIGGVVPLGETKEWLSQFKFIICYENQRFDGYITEKVFNAYYAGAIPIYWGDRSVLKDINPKAIIFAPDFESEDALIAHIKKVDQDDALYKRIWSEPLMVDPDYSYAAYQGRLRKKISQIIIPKL